MDTRGQAGRQDRRQDRLSGSRLLPKSYGGAPRDAWGETWTELTGERAEHDGMTRGPRESTLINGPVRERRGEGSELVRSLKQGVWGVAPRIDDLGVGQGLVQVGGVMHVGGL